MYRFREQRHTRVPLSEGKYTLLSGRPASGKRNPRKRIALPLRLARVATRATRVFVRFWPDFYEVITCFGWARRRWWDSHFPEEWRSTNHPETCNHDHDHSFSLATPVHSPYNNILYLASPFVRLPLLVPPYLELALSFSQHSSQNLSLSFALTSLLPFETRWLCITSNPNLPNP